MSQTIIDANSEPEKLDALKFTSNEGVNSILSGITIKNCGNRAIYVSNACPSISNCTIAGCHQGIYASNNSSSTTFRINSCEIQDCNVVAGIYVTGMPAYISNCTIKTNESGIITYAPNSSTHIKNTTIAKCRRGCIAATGAEVVIDNSILTNNVARSNRYSAAVSVSGINGRIANTIISGNDGYSNFYPNASIISTGFSSIESLVLENTTLTGNRTGTYLISVTGELKILNCIIYGNVPYAGGIYSTKGTLCRYSDIQSGRNAFKSAAGQSLSQTYRYGNIDQDPCFVSPGTWNDVYNTPSNYIDDQWSDGDYHLKSEGWRFDQQRKTWTWDDQTSRCIDAGDPSSSLRDEAMSIPEDPNNEFGENIRIDMGAYGGTNQASIPPAGWNLLADNDNNGIVNLTDCSILASDLLNGVNGPNADYNHDAKVDFEDIRILSSEWLEFAVWK